MTNRPTFDGMDALDLGAFPSGLSKVPLDVNGTMVNLMGGFLAVEQDPRDLAVSPLVGWCIAA
jgi:hypothetical protein